MASLWDKYKSIPSRVRLMFGLSMGVFALVGPSLTDYFVPKSDTQKESISASK
eukprot:m.341686 g.341686  ORF g.341686 m.341686 type:complete len:53 (-) comp20351_c0_seq1:53-211(-)